MNCSACEIPLITMFYEGTRVRVCGRCSGVLVGHEQLKRIVQRREVEIPRAQGLVSEQGAEQPRVCPTCKVAMAKRRYRSAITVDQCSQCRSVWLDRGELEDLQLLAEMAADEKAGAPRDGSRHRPQKSEPVRSAVSVPSPVAVPSPPPPPLPAVQSMGPAAVAMSAVASFPAVPAPAPRPPQLAVQITCAKCATVQSEGVTCVSCGVVFAKIAGRKSNDQAIRGKTGTAADAVLGRAAGLSIREHTALQSLDHSLDKLLQGKIDLSFGDRYDIHDNSGRKIAHARHVSGRGHSLSMSRFRWCRE